jgi:hypothetical protein
MAKFKITFQSIRQYARFIWEVTSSEGMEANKVLGKPIIQNEGLITYIPRYTVIKKGVIKDVREDMELETLSNSLTRIIRTNTPYLSRSLMQSYLR